VKAPVVEKTAAATVAPVDVLDEIDTDITDFEDRAFAEDVVSGRV